MSKQYLEQIAALFKSGEILGLIATECVSNGFDVADIRLIVLLGVAKSVDEGDQRGGRGGRDAERWAFENLAANNPDHKPGNKEERTNRSSIEYASTKLCKRKFLADYNEDTTAEALLCDGPCCDNDDPSFDLSDFLLGFSVDEESDSDLPAKKPRRKYRPVVAREPLDDAIRSWRDTTHEADLVLKSFPKSYIISNKSIGLLARERPQTFRIPADITTFLNETSDWHSRHALDILTLIHIHDSRRRVLDSDDSTSASDSETESVSAQSGQEQFDSSPVGSPSPSATSSRSNTPEPAQSPPPLVTTVGRPVRRAAREHAIAGMADQVSKRQRIAE
ncbi:hypothetical protein R3P38DRAFT_3230810 [Favolaschia claudopus]|uniref:Helicase C-terminal domain-containing protein n=1 Tax=Favolaschia claudopus TaxID=2862362 RepID=A0AAV9ZLR3_9AGAR